MTTFSHRSDPSASSPRWRNAGLSIECVAGSELEAVLPDLARLRLSVFRAFPYLYDGDEAYETRYLADYARSSGAVVVIAKDASGCVVGAATAAPLGDHQPQLGASLARLGYPASDVFYLGESVLLPAYRGHGIGHAFFDEREAAASAQGFPYATFCAVIRPADHPERPNDYAPLDPFWRSHRYRPVEGLTAPMSWRDVGDADETVKTMQFWLRDLRPHAP